MFGITGNYDAGEGDISFEAPLKDAEAKIKTLPLGSVKIIRIYAHGMPGMIGDFDCAKIVSLLGDRMCEGGRIQLLGCSTAGPDANAWNPIGGLGLLARMATTMPFSNDENPWTQDLARQVSSKIPGVYVVGLSGISFPLSRIPEKLGLDWEGHAPWGLMANRYWYKDGRKLPRSEWPGTGSEAEVFDERSHSPV